MRIRSYILPALSILFTLCSLYAMVRIARFSSTKIDASKIEPVAAPPGDVHVAPKLFTEMARRRPIPAGIGGNVDQAETRAAKEPNDPAAQKILGLSYYASGSYDLAAKTLQRATTLSPNDADVWKFYGFASMGQENIDTAISALETSLRLKPSADAACELGNLYFQSKHDNKKALPNFVLSLKLKPSADAYIGRGSLAAEAGDRGTAEKSFTAALALLNPGPRRATVYACLGRLADEQKKSTDAISWYKKALADDPQNQWAASHLEAPKKP